MKKIQPKVKQYKGYDDWFDGLPFDKQMFVAQHVKKKIDKINADTTEILDSCYLGSMIEVLEMDLDDCIKIASKANENMQITQKILDSKKGNEYYMRINNDKLRSQIREEAKAMLKSNPKESTISISKELEKNYNLPFKDLHIIVAEARKEIQTEKVKDKDIKVNIPATEKEKEEFLREIGVGIDEHLNKKEIPVKDVVEVLGVEQAEFVNPDYGFEMSNEEYLRIENEKDKTVIKHLIEGKETKSKLEFKESGSVILTVENKPTLKIKSIEVEGIHGTYFKGAEGVKTGDKVYKDIIEVEEEKKTLQVGYEATIENINEQIEKLKKQLEETNNFKQKELEKYEEIEQVFNM